MQLDGRMQKYWLPWLVGMPAETATAMCCMIFGGVLERFPKLKVVGYALLDSTAKYRRISRTMEGKLTRMGPIFDQFLVCNWVLCVIMTHLISSYILKACLLLLLASSNWPKLF